MGQCLCKDRSGTDGAADAYGVSASVQSPLNLQSSTDGPALTTSQHATRLRHIGIDVAELIAETLVLVRTLVNKFVLPSLSNLENRIRSEQEAPASMLKLNLIAEKETGWLLVTRTMLERVPLDHPLGAAVITLFLDESPLPTKETVSTFINELSLPANNMQSVRATVWHRNVCVILATLAEKLVGALSAQLLTDATLEYLVSKLDITLTEPVVTLFALIALEKYALTTTNRSIINERLKACDKHPLIELERHLLGDDWQPESMPPTVRTRVLLIHQTAVCAQYCLDNVFVPADNRPYSCEHVDTSRLGALLNHEDASEYIKIAPTGLEARSDVQSFESVRSTFQIETGVWYYEVMIITDGVMQIGWATKNSRFLNHDGYGIGDDEYSVSYDGCRQLVWHNARSVHNFHRCWQPGDIVGCLLDITNRQVQFYLNGEPLRQSHSQLFLRARAGFFAAASFMSFQQCRFNFGHKPFQYAPSGVYFENMNNAGTLTEAQQMIIPKRRKLEMMKSISVPENSCQLCFAVTATVMLLPCKHSGYCTTCAMQLTKCALCRAHIDERVEVLEEVDLTAPVTLGTYDVTYHAAASTSV